MTIERQSALRLRAGSQIGTYKIQRLVNRGKTTAVYRAQSPRFKREVAFKVFLTDDSASPELTAHFNQEAQAIAALKHPNIIRILDYDHYRAMYYVVFEWITGTNLRDLLSTRPTGLGREETGRLFGQIANAVASSHEQNVIHGNIKPDNVLLDAGQRPVLTDFTIPCLFSPDSRESAPGGPNTIAYQSPEQIAGLPPASPASDIFALGVLLYEMVTGTVPYQGKNHATRAITTAPIPPSQIRVGLDPRIDQVVLKALSQQPADRYSSVRDMLSDLERRESVGIDYDTLTLDRSSSEAIRRSKSEIRRFERSRVIERPQLPTPEPAKPKAPIENRHSWMVLGISVAVIVLALAIAALTIWT